MSDKAFKSRTQTGLHTETVTSRVNLQILDVPIEHLKANPNNARVHPVNQISKLKASIEQFGFLIPVLVNVEGFIIAGHGRIEAGRQLGLKTVPAIRVDHLSEAEIRAFTIADNRLAELSSWDRETLAGEFQGLLEVAPEIDLEISGFEMPEIDILIEELQVSPGADPADDFECPDDRQKPVTEPDDLWILGNHRILHGSAVDLDGLSRLMNKQPAKAAFIDPPYNVPIKGFVSGLGNVTHREFAMASGEMTKTEYTSFLTNALDAISGQCLSGALIYTFIDWRHLQEMLTAGQNTGLSLINLCVWCKDNGGMGSFYRSRHEDVCVFKLGDAPHTNNVRLGSYGRNRTNVWEYPGVNTFRSGRLDDLAMHPTVKPVALVADAILDCTRRGDVVLDTFSGSGTTIIAAERVGRRAFCVEIDPIYVDTSIRRWEKVTGDEAVHAVTGKTFRETGQERASARHPTKPGYRVRRRKGRTENV